jgi:hypothetical protein
VAGSISSELDVRREPYVLTPPPAAVAALPPPILLCCKQPDSGMAVAGSNAGVHVENKLMHFWVHSKSVLVHAGTPDSCTANRPGTTYRLLRSIHGSTAGMHHPCSY